jgi:TatD DNase family protein
MIDSHVHLDRPEFAEDRLQVLSRAQEAGVAGFLNVGYDLASSRTSAALAAADDRVLATVGVHPHDAAQLADAAGTLTAAGRDSLAALRDLARDPAVVGIGETGLDFFRDLSPRTAQRRALTAQLELAAQLRLPVVLHIRDAYEETLAVLEEVGVPQRGAVLHSFAGEARHARWARERGCLLGIGGPITYRNGRLPQVLVEAGITPDDVLLETDAPWLPPVPHRGRRNEPSFLTHTRDRLAELLGIAPAALAAATDANFRRLFGRLPRALDAAAGGSLV